MHLESSFSFPKQVATISDTKADDPIRLAHTYYLRHASNYEEHGPRLQAKIHYSVQK